MGNVEKWVVLGVLGLIVGILVVSLTVDDPLKKDGVVVQGGSSQGLPPAAEPEPTVQAEPKSSALMNSSVSTEPEAPEAAPAVAVPEAVPPGSILKTMEGLEPSFMPDAKFYVWKSGDTFPALAQRYYGDLARLATLRRVNEGRTDVQPGDRVMIPVFDPDVPTPVAAPVAATPAASKATDAKAAAAPAAATGSRLHLVAEGESLWIIAKKELGSGARWKEIYEANRDQLASPEALRTGIKLRVP